MKGLHIIEIDANMVTGVRVQKYPITKETERGVVYQREDGSTHYYGVKNMYLIQIMAHGTKARCVFPCEEREAEEMIHLRKLMMIDALHAEGQRRAVNLAKMEDEV